jgi:FMN phosphatase YigB (HAD superfamily)
MKKKIVFFDGDGTLWYPKKTKHTKGPWWIYQLKGNYKYHNTHLVMTPTAINTIKKLKKMGIITVILSTHPHPPKEADLILGEKIKHFKLDGLFDEVIATRDKGPHKHKGKIILKVLKRRGIPKSKALMIGDNYVWDYKPAREAGIDALLIETTYEHQNPTSKKVKKTISKLSDVLHYVD